jgi:hypothetical protein
VEDPVLNIIQQLKDIPEISDLFDIGNRVIFENHPHAISDVSEEVVARETQTPSTPPRTPNQRRDLHQLRADQICIYRSRGSNSSSRTMLYISEYKPPHKLTPAHLRLGLRPMNMYKDVVNRKTIHSTDDKAARFQYYADRLTASAITQTYNYMIEGGLQYSLLTTGEAIVFLKIDWDDPATLYYHLAEPGPEAAAHPDQLHLCTAVGQHMTFTLMALEKRREYGQEARQRVKQTLHTWAEDFETTVRLIPRDERTASSDATYIPEPTTYHNVDRSPIFNRLRRRVPRPDQCDISLLKVHDDTESSDDESSSNRKPPDTPTPNAESTGTRRSQRILAQRPRGGGSTKKGEKADNNERRVGSAGNGGVNPDRPYCSQRCLLGLVNGHKLDTSCPNVGLHRKNGRAGHPIDHTRWLALLYDQLKQSLDDGIVPLGNGGARGVLFKVTLLAYGYTFVSKGTVKAFIPDLEHEAAVYKRLLPVQGRHVPVFLGSVDLRSMQKIYYYDHRVYVVYLVFLSWAGCSIYEAEDTGLAKDRLYEMAKRSLQAVHSQNVVHKDVRAANMLFSKETNSVMLIDFERAKLHDARPALSALAPGDPNKRTRAAEGNPNKRPRKNSERSGALKDCFELSMTFSSGLPQTGGHMP